MKNKTITKKLKRYNGGITLISLVISIIILLILAGVTIATLTGDNSLIRKIGEAKNTTEEIAIKEELEVNVLSSYKKRSIDYNLLNSKLSNINGLKYKNNLLSNINVITEPPAVVEKNGYLFQIKTDGTVISIKPQEIGNLTKENYGDYLNLDKSIVGTYETLDDWQIIYNDRIEKKYMLYCQIIYLIVRG